jgi:hypothetical protein
MKPSSSLLAIKTLFVTLLVACTSFGQTSNRIIDLSKVNLSNKTNGIKSETRQGPGSGGGGNTCALMLKQNAIELIEIIGTYPPFQTDGIGEIIIANIKAAQFIPGENLQIDGKDVEAVNYPTKKIIEVEQTFCDKVSTFSTDSLGITLHEYLGLAGLADEEYQVSGPFISAIYTAQREENNSSGVSFLDHQVNNLRTKFKKSTPLNDDQAGVKTFNLSCTYFGESAGKYVKETFKIQRSSDQNVLMQASTPDVVSVKTQNTSAGLMVSLPAKNSTSTSLMVLRQLAPEVFIAEWSILGNTLLDTIRLRTGAYPVPSISVVASQAMGYSLCLPNP